MSVVVPIVLFLVLTVFILVVPCLFFVLVGNLKEKKYVCGCPDCPSPCFDCFVLVVLVGGVLVVFLVLVVLYFFLVLVGNLKEKNVSVVVPIVLVLVLFLVLTFCLGCSHWWCPGCPMFFPCSGW